MADELLAGADELLGLLESGDLWSLAVDPDDPPCDDEAIDTCLRAIADFVDLKSPYLLGHSSGVAALAAGAAGACGLAPTEVTASARTWK